MPTHWFTADTHFGHENVIPFCGRPFRQGSLHLFGHVHNQWRGSRNTVNVGVDVCDYMPVTLRDIERRARTLTPNAHWADVEHGAELT